MRPLRKLYQRCIFIISVNWVKTLYFNFRMFPLNQAIKLPVYFYGSVKFKHLTGKITINAPLKKGMIGFGQAYEIMSRSKGIAELSLEGTVTFYGHVQFGKDYFVFVGPNASLKMGNMASLGNSGKIICYENIELGNFARIGFESQLSDTTAHQMMNTVTGEKYPMTTPIRIGNFNYISNRVTVLVNDVEELVAVELSEATKELEKATAAIESAETSKARLDASLELKKATARLEGINYLS